MAASDNPGLRRRPREQALAQVTRMAEAYVARGPYVFYPDEVRVRNILKGLAKNKEKHGLAYCPCQSEEEVLACGRRWVCPCTPHGEDIARQGYCDCALFASEEFVREYREKKR
ncbi:MAG: ferredoxin:thioredoxin reductase [Chrysiogenetes bacterium]|nr:ferredoxin:thioredoxin reductase [Chrysiogenetes bacterium]